jgi:hypothetical protein
LPEDFAMTTLAPSISISDVFAKLRQALQLLADIESLPQPITSADGLRQAIDDLAQLATLLGIDSTWSDRLTTILSDQTVFDLVLAVVQALFASPMPPSPAPNPAPTAVLTTVDPQLLAQWLPLVVQIISLIRQIRGGL